MSLCMYLMCKYSSPIWSAQTNGIGTITAATVLIGTTELWTLVNMSKIAIVQNTLPSVRSSNQPTTDSYVDEVKFENYILFVEKCISATANDNAK